jgi:hypothetical protein
LFCRRLDAVHDDVRNPRTRAIGPLNGGGW